MTEHSGHQSNVFDPKWRAFYVWATRIAYVGSVIALSTWLWRDWKMYLHPLDQLSPREGLSGLLLDPVTVSIFLPLWTIWVIFDWRDPAWIPGIHEGDGSMNAAKSKIRRRRTGVLLFSTALGMALHLLFLWLGLFVWTFVLTRKDDPEGLAYIAVISTAYLVAGAILGSVDYFRRHPSLVPVSGLLVYVTLICMVTFLVLRGLEPPVRKKDLEELQPFFLQIVPTVVASWIGCQISLRLGRNRQIAQDGH